MPALARSAALDDAPRTLITGSTSGIGRALAAQLAPRGPLVLADRATVDLTSFDAVEGYVEDLTRQRVRLARIICNAGVHVPFRRVKTADGVELHEQVNASSHLLLVLGLLERGVLAGDAQVLYIGSEAHRMARWPRAPLAFWHAYARSKELATAAFFALAARLPELDVRVISPGPVETEVGRHKPAVARSAARLLERAATAGDAAAQILGVAGAPRRATSQAYYHLGQPAQPSERTLDPERAVAAFNQVATPFRHRLGAPWSAPLVALTTHARTCSWVSPPPQVPATVEELATLVGRARGEGRRLRVIGKLHSYNDCARSDCYQVSLERLTDVSIGADRRTASVAAGATVRAVCDALDGAGLTLPWSGNYGEQTFVGAVLTGTHGYAREGGLLAQLITEMTIIDGRGKLRVITDEDELRALRVSFGAIGIVTSMRVAVREKPGHCRYHLEHVTTPQLLERLEEACAGHDHFRFFPSRILPGHHATLAIDHLDAPPAPEERTTSYAYVDRGPVPRWLVALVRVLLGSRLVLALVRRTRLARATMTAVIPFSSYLFINAGITTGRPVLGRALYQAWNDDRTHNMSFGVPTDQYGAFHAMFEALVARFRASDRAFTAYYTARYVGAQDRAYLGASYGMAVAMLDIHVPKDAGRATEFLAELDALARVSLTVRPHWGKELFAGGEELRRTLPDGAIAAMRALQQRYDPDGVFSSPFTRRVIGT